MAYINRRSFMQSTAGLFVAFSMPRAAAASATTVAGDSVDAYLAVAPDGSVTVFAGKVDLGTGARAALRHRHEHRPHAGGSQPAVLPDARAHSPDRGQGVAETQAS